MPIRALSASALLLVFASSAHAQSARPLLEPSLQVELDGAERQAALADGLYIGGGAVGGAGLLVVLGTSIALAECAGSCAPDVLAGAEIALGVGVGVAGAALITLLVATFVDQDAERWRRRVLSRDMGFGIAPSRGGAVLGWRQRF